LLIDAKVGSNKHYRKPMKKCWKNSGSPWIYDVSGF
jgi:hypothetical protein